MSARKVIRKVHLWLGLASGIIVVFLGITGCILAFELEIRKITEPYRFVERQAFALKPPSVLAETANAHLQFGKALGIEYPGEGKAAVAYYYDSAHYELVFLNPYTGNFLHRKNMDSDFFRVILEGHYNLWLPVHIGKPIVSSATLIFLVMMITGLILWWPRNKSARKQRFTIKWNVRWRRKNYDLHSVLGFYMTWIAIFIAITGLVFGFEWFAKSVYWVSSGGEAMEMHQHPASDTTQPASFANLADQLWLDHKKHLQAGESIGVYFAHSATDPVEIVINHRPGTYYNSDFFHYDQYTGKRLHAFGSWEGKFSEASLADKIIRMNYDIHVGAILGLTGKILAFLASLLAASLPVTGFLLWRGRVRKRPNKKRSPDLLEQFPVVIPRPSSITESWATEGQ